METICFEIANIIARFAVTPTRIRIKHHPAPFDNPHLITLVDEIELEVKQCQDTLLALSLVNHQWHNAVQPHLATNILLSSSGVRMWPITFDAIQSVLPLFPVSRSANMSLRNVHYMDKNNILHTYIPHFHRLTTLTMTIYEPISAKALDTFKSQFVPIALNIKILNIRILNINTFSDYSRLVIAIMALAPKLESLDWTCMYKDSTTLFFRHLKKAQRLLRLNLRLPFAYISPAVHFAAELPLLQCLEISPIGVRLGNHCDLLGDWHFPSFKGFFVYGKEVYEEVEYFIDAHDSKIQELYLEHLWSNEDVLESCTHLEKLLIDFRARPLLEGQRPTISHPTVKTIIIDNLYSNTLDTALLYRLINRAYFPFLQNIQLLSIGSTSVTTSSRPALALQDISDWLTECCNNGVGILDGDGEVVNIL